MIPLARGRTWRECARRSRLFTDAFFAELCTITTLLSALCIEIHGDRQHLKLRRVISGAECEAAILNRIRGVLIELFHEPGRAGSG
jgi:hypothetical protein